MAQSSSPWSEPALHCACFNLRKAARAVTQMYDAALAPSGLKATQFTVLVAAALAGGAPLTRLAAALVMDRTTLTRNLRPLMADGLIRAERGEDGRERRIRLTRRGRAALERTLPLWREAQTRMLTSIGTPRWQSILRDLAAVVDAAEATQPPSARP